MFKKVILVLVNLALLLTSTLLIIFTDFNNISRGLSIFLTVLPEILIILICIFNWLNLKLLRKLSYLTYIILCLVLIGYSLLYRYNVLHIFLSVSSLKEYILSTKEKGVFIYIILQLMQVVFLPIPASVICIVGSLIYGPLLGGIYCCIGVLLGSYISFFLGRFFGYKLVSWVVGKDNVDKYASIIKTRGVFFLGLAFLLPMFPDDILCFIAGITKLSVKQFFWIALITRPIGVICMSYFGGGYIIPFSGWGIYAWIGILILALILIFVLYKWQTQIQDFILKKVFRNKVDISHKKNDF